MEIVVIGASGKTGLQLVSQGLERGHQITAFVRQRNKLTISHPNLHIFEGDALAYEHVQEAIIGKDVVICAIGASDLKTSTLRSETTANIVRALETKNPDARLIVISSLGVGYSMRQLPLTTRFMISIILRNVLKDHNAQEDIVRDSKLSSWLVVRPTGMRDDSLSKQYNVTKTGMINSRTISRADVAHFIMEEVENPTCQEAFVAIG